MLSLELGRLIHRERQLEIERELRVRALLEPAEPECPPVGMTLRRPASRPRQQVLGQAGATESR